MCTEHRGIKMETVYSHIVVSFRNEDHHEIPLYCNIIIIFIYARE